MLVPFVFLTGCIFGQSSELKRAEKLLNNFQCKNVETSEMPTSSINSYYQQTLAVSKDKATSYVESYKEGEELFAMPLDEVVKKQYELYKAACDSLGGVSAQP
ncbi:TPA: hypothetical protein JIZ13_12930 [Acinetobacter nosocomialis]|uniref:Uncharacterized protein n=1 Tax=Acinetobacter nosocomialis TaxID=106654 RepID=A0A1V0YXB7_ACINO|nr:hypothetical protein B7L44_15105 [Acinetobacter nosocomialis]ELW76878.1 hypothetical protein ACIN5021_1165 [Acinetobacter sp. OIFC021]EXB71100.1 hypothetical protein J525_0630 [Acinetobacter sp. 21871]EXE51325.1 hypothetical protein J576_1105 [Acinetobacter sp. 766875]EXE79043.1 hypothetical protein J582_0705 [Acinetobacter sp. 1566109]EXR60788.1 hypothetical protein J678_3131 [Acinetobacter sp. 1424608]EXT37650.1 hypothetical protein J811_2728 [Acinetobacter sp. 25977_8]EXT43268.1 hypoth